MRKYLNMTGQPSTLEQKRAGVMDLPPAAEAWVANLLAVPDAALNDPECCTHAARWIARAAAMDSLSMLDMLAEDGFSSQHYEGFTHVFVDAKYALMPYLVTWLRQYDLVPVVVLFNGHVVGLD